VKNVQAASGGEEITQGGVSRLKDILGRGEGVSGVKNEGAPPPFKTFEYERSTLSVREWPRGGQRG